MQVDPSPPATGEPIQDLRRVGAAAERGGALTKSPWVAVQRIWTRLRGTYESRFLYFILLNYFGLKGVLLGLLNAAGLPFFQSMNVSGNEYQLATMVSMIPWSMKGFIGVLSDCVPIGRYHKRGYLLTSSCAGLLGLAALSWVDIDSVNAEMVWTIATYMCLVNIMIATFDLLCEGKYSEVMRETGSGSEVITLVWSCLNIGGLLASFAVYVYVQNKDTANHAQSLLKACAPLVAIAAWRSYTGDVPEEPARSWLSLWRKVMSAPGLFLLAFAMVVGTLATAVASACLDSDGRAVVAMTSSVILVVCAFKALPATMARGNLYFFMVSVAYLDLSGPLAYFYTGTEQCVQNGPHFSYGYYLAVSNAVGCCGSVLGAVMFQYMQAMQFRTAFIVTTMLQVLASTFDLFLVTRMNLRVGVSDEAAYLFGDAACQSIAQQMAAMPMALLTSRLCPRGAEATVFAILAGFQNFGSAVSTVLGAKLADHMGVIAQSHKGPCNFTRLPELIILSHMLAPLLCLPFTWCLIPAARIDDEQAWTDVSAPPSFQSPAPSPPGTPDLRVRAVREGADGDEYVLLQESEASSPDGSPHYAVFR
mmetsp:Transcript_65868/g.122934  ORF Transcript_65868/g.122934 Transcript_65868/m.122934 type:complete len:591 (+) Transcript_65868:131-1903(+)